MVSVVPRVSECMTDIRNEVRLLELLRLLRLPCCCSIAAVLHQKCLPVCLPVC